MARVIGFARVSTRDQSLERQMERLREAGADEVLNGTRSGMSATNAEALRGLLETVEPGDTVLVTALDRLGRSVSQVVSTVESLHTAGVNLRTLDQGIDTSKTDPMSKAMVHLMAMFAELERNTIAERCQSGKQATGRYGGRPHRLTPAQRKQARHRHAQGESIRSLAAVYNVSRQTIRRAVTEQ